MVRRSALRELIVRIGYLGITAETHLHRPLALRTRVGLWLANHWPNWL